MTTSVIKRKINLEDSISRQPTSNWGVMTATTFYINVMLTQTIYDMGMFTDVGYVSEQPNYTLLTDKLTLSGYTFPFMTGATVNSISATTNDEFILRLPSNTEIDYYRDGLVISGLTDSKIDDLKSYNASDTYISNFDINKQGYINYNGVSVSGHSRIVSTNDPIVYVFDAITGVTMGTNSQVHGLQYKDYTATTRNVSIDGIKDTIPLTEMRYIGEGWNETNVSLSAITKEEYLFGITSKPTVESDIFIDRGITTVMDKHLRLSEIRNIDELVRYGNGLYNIRKQ